jgi:hypothetical protein
MKEKIILLAISLVFINSACTKECKNFTQYQTAPVILEYFGNYKPGNYWIYENQDGTKKDSMWVSDYKESTGERLTCIKYPVRQYILHSRHLGIIDELKVEVKLNSVYYHSIGTIGYYTLLASNDTALRNEKFLFKYKNSVGSLLFPIVSKISIIKEYENPNIIYAKEIGIIQFHSKSINNFYTPLIMDTFYLTKYSIK